MARVEGGGTHGHSGTASAKAHARAAARARRTEIHSIRDVLASSVLRISADRGVTPGSRDRLSIAAYASYGHEPATEHLIADLLDQGHRVLLPRMVDDRLAWVEVDARTTYAINDRGIREPDGPDAGLSGVDIVLVPALAVTTAGDRLGQGAGFYDRALAGIPRFADGGPLLIAVVFAGEVHDAPTWPVEEHDIRMDAILTVD